MDKITQNTLIRRILGVILLLKILSVLLLFIWIVEIYLSKKLYEKVTKIEKVLFYFIKVKSNYTY